MSLEASFDFEGRKKDFPFVISHLPLVHAC